MKKRHRSEFARPVAQRAPGVADPALASGAVPGTGADSDEEAVSERGLRWQTENQIAIDCYNSWIAEHPLPLEEFRRF
jgi:hypothetical protein